MTIAGGFLTFPLLTRMLSKADYGVLNLVNTAIGLCVIASKFGLQNASIRFLPKALLEGERASKQIYSTVVITSFFISLFSGSLLVIFSSVLFPHFTQEDIQYIIPCAAVLVVIRVLYLSFLTFFRANQKSFQVSLYQIANKYLAIIFLFLWFFLYEASDTVFFRVLLASELTILTVCAINFSRYNSLDFKEFSSPFLKKAVNFGLPLLGFELITEFLAYGDRYLIQYFLGAEELAVYSAGYNLADYARTLLLYPLAFAATPIITELWETKGKSVTEKFVSENLSNYWYILIPAIFGVSLLGGDLVVVLASEKYASSYLVIPYVMIGATLYGTFPLTGAGLFVSNHTNILFYLVCVAAILNILLNIFLIPLHGILGAAESTLISYLILCVMIVLASRRYLQIKIISLSIPKALLASSAMLLILNLLKPLFLIIASNKFIWLLNNAVFGALSYLIIIAMLDKKIRYMAVKKLKTIF